MKTIKCAGTSVQNMLLRYSLKHNLNVVLPEREKNDSANLDFDYSVQNLHGVEFQTRFSREMIDNTIWEKANLSYHMFLLHTRWNHHEVSRVLKDQGQENVFYFSILRDPVMLFRSYWDYFGLSKKYGKTLDEYAKTEINEYVLYNNMTYCVDGYNRMLTDFGMYCHDMLKQEGTKTESTELIHNKLQEIEENFDLILIADSGHYEDGMILLKHALCWDYKDIINVPHNVFSETQPSYYSEEARKIIKGIKAFHNYVLHPYDLDWP